MTDKELKKLKRADLLEMLLMQSKENDALQAKLDEALAKLQQRQIQINTAGSIAQAALAINGVFEAAQNAGAQYLENIERLSREQESICSWMIADSQEKAAQILSEIQHKCQMMERNTREMCDNMLTAAKQQSKEYWKTVSQQPPGIHKGKSS